MPDHLAGYGHGVEPLMWTTDEGQTFPVVAVEYALIDKDTLFCLDCEGRAGPSCGDYHGHGVATLDELMDAYSNPAFEASLAPADPGGEDREHGS